MDKNIKYTMLITAAVTFFWGTDNFTPLNILSKAAYASSYELNELHLETTGGGDINLYENDNYTKELDSNKSLEKTYYAKISSDRSKVAFDTSGFSGTIKIFKSNSKKVYDDGDEISVSTGKTTFYIRLYDTYNEEKPTDCKKEYKVIIKRYTSEEENEIKNDDQGDIYLQTIQLDYGDIPLNFDKEKSTYNVKVNTDVKSIPIKAEPEDGATVVRINNITVDENDDYKKIVNLDKGDNKIEISLSQFDEEKRTYILNINRQDSSEVASENISGNDNDNIQTTNTSESNLNDTNNSENNTANTALANKWVKVMDKWKYNDSYGQFIKNKWYYDNTYGRNYYFDNNGDMVTGWLNLNNNWYYLNNSGEMETGWKKIGYNWYYLDYDGKMKTGWFKDSNGKYYYLYESNGAMAHDTTINGYKLGSNGAWIK